MEKNFSLYLIRIGILEEASIPLKTEIKNKESVKNFTNSSFYYLMNYFDNLTEKQKKYMSFYIPAKYKLILEENKKLKLKSIIIQYKLRQKLILLKYFYLWKRYIKDNIPHIKKNSKIFMPKNLRNEDIKIKDDKYLFENDNNKFDFDINKDEYSISNTENKNILDDKNIEVDPIYKMQQISQNTISLEDIFVKNANNNENKKNKKTSNKKEEEYLSNIKNILKYNTLDINPYKAKNKNRINNIKYNIKKRRINNIIKYKDFRNKNKESENIIKNSTRNNTNRKEKIYTSLEEKEMEELKECTFQPKINNSRTHKRIRNILSEGKTTSAILSKKEIQSTFDKLYHDSEKYKLTKELKIIDYEYLLGKNTSFSPNISHNYNFRKSFNIIDKNFEERQKEYLSIINKKNEELKNKLESDYEISCSFNPQIKQDKDEYNQIKKEKQISVPVFERLYQDCKIRKNSLIRKEMENINKFN